MILVISLTRFRRLKPLLKALFWIVVLGLLLFSISTWLTGPSIPEPTLRRPVTGEPPHLRVGFLFGRKNPMGHFQTILNY